MRRLFYLAVGAGIGIVAVRRATAAAERWGPQGLAARIGDASEQVQAWWADVQRLAAEREIELREALGLEWDGDRE